VQTISCQSDKQIKLESSVLNNLSMDKIQLPNDSDKNLYVLVDGKKSRVQNISSSGKNTQGTYYAYLDTMDDSVQLLLVVNKNENIFSWSEYYPGISHFYKDKLFLIAVKPYMERHLNQDIRIINMSNGKVVYNKNKSFKISDETTKMQEFYYLTPRFGIGESNTELNVYWDQAHFPVIKFQIYTDQTDWAAYSSNYDKYSLNELKYSSKSTGNFPLDSIQGNYTLVCSGVVGDYHYAIATKIKDSTSWEDYYLLITNSVSKEIKV